MTKSKRSPWTWAAVFAVYAVGIMALSESDKYGEIGSALAWLVLFGAVVYNWNGIAQNLSPLTGVGIQKV